MEAPKKSIWTRVVALLMIMLVLTGLFAYVVKDVNPKETAAQVPDYKAWDRETIKLMNQLPLQDGGRIKPFSTHAAFTMMRMRGDRKIEITNSAEEKIAIKPSAWMMDCLFRPTLAVQMPTFRVDNFAAIDAIGLKSHGRRDRYTYKELEEALPKLFELAQSYESIEDKKRDVVQKQVIDLAYNVRNFQFLIGYFGFARSAIEMKGAAKDGVSSSFTDFSTVMATAPMIVGMAQESQATGKPIPPNLESMLQQVLDGANFAKFGLVLLPPDEKNEKDWRSAGDRIMDVMSSKLKDPKTAIEDIKVIENTVRSSPLSEQEFRAALKIMVDRFADRAKAREEYRSIAAENTYNANNFIFWVMFLFILALITAIIMWLMSTMNAPSWAVKTLHYLSLGSSITGAGLLIAAIGMRCYIMWRPPVGNLYDTVIFICTAVVLFLFMIEYFTRQRIATTLAALIGLGLVILARRFELGDAKDHMDPLVAVLNSNYWLTTHVITVTLGYAAGLLMAFLSISFVLMSALGLASEMKQLLKHITVATYGCLCLTLFLSLVGTVLGGIWANDSWGRFWGWDPKENGALMIVLWSLIILHARLGGLIRVWGLHICSIFMACIVFFSWWHVNFLGVGLHNYGFTSGKTTIWFFYLTMVLFMIFAAVLWAMEQMEKSATAETLPAETENDSPVAT